jgi:periplasmic copper chaperone A
MIVRDMLGGFLALFIAVASAGQTHQYRLGPIEIDNPWSRATVSAAPNGVVYVTIRNTGQTADKLLDVASPAADQAQIHDMKVENDVSQMWLVGAVDIPAGQTLTLAPNGLHIMLLGLKKPLEIAQTFPLTLTFEKAGTITVDVMVEPMGATEPSQGS